MKDHGRVVAEGISCFDGNLVDAELQGNAGRHERRSGELRSGPIDVNERGGIVDGTENVDAWGRHGRSVTGGLP
jgi:hypothetical protein